MVTSPRAGVMSASRWLCASSLQIMTPHIVFFCVLDVPITQYLPCNYHEILFALWYVVVICCSDKWNELFQHLKKLLHTHCASVISHTCPGKKHVCKQRWTYSEDEVIFLASLLENQLCGNTGLVKYQLMTCESCISIVLMWNFFPLFFLFFLLPGLTKIQLCKLFLCLPWKLFCSRFPLLYVTHTTASSSTTKLLLQLTAHHGLKSISLDCWALINLLLREATGAW